MSPPFSIVIHGGAGTILREQMSDEMKRGIVTDLESSIRKAYEVLKVGGNAVDAVIEAVKVLENSEYFNAGKGSVLTHEGRIEMDASIMYGKDKAAGAVAGVRHVKHPVVLARDVMRNSKHVFLAGEGAEEFARAQGHEFVEQEYLMTQRRQNQLVAMKKKGLFALSESRYPDDQKHGTVGAVALDQHGNLAAATSSGGVTNKKYGRVGDSAVIGAGTVAENNNVAVSTTGMGEFFIRNRVASDVAARMRYLKHDLRTACEAVIHEDLQDLGGEGGLIAIDSKGQIQCVMNTPGMYRAFIDVDGNLQVKIYCDE